MLSIYKKTAAVLISAAVMVTFAACSGQAGDMTDNSGSKDNQVAGASRQTVFGYILEANRQTRTVLVDTFELSSAGGETNNGLRDSGVIRTADGRYLNEAGGRFLYPLSPDVYLELSDKDYGNSALYNSRYAKTDSGVFSTDRENSGLTDMTGGKNDNSLLNMQGDEKGGDANDAVERMERSANDVLREGMEGIDDITNNTEIYRQGYDLLTDDDAEKITDKQNGGTDPSSQKQSSSAKGFYKGNDVTKLHQRISEFKYIPFRLVLEEGKVVRIVEMPELYD